VSRSVISSPSELSPSPASCDPSVWNVITRLFGQLEMHRKASEQIKGTLMEAVRKASEADTASWLDEESEEALTTTPCPTLSREQCQAIAETLLNGAAVNQASLIRHPAREASSQANGRPHGSAELRANSSHMDWVTAQVAQGGRPLNGAGAGLIGMTGALLGKQSQHFSARIESTESFLGLVRCLSAVIDARDRCTAGHSMRVSRIAVVIGRQLGFSPGAIHDLQLAGLLHDVGKIGIRDEILFKPGKLTDEEHEHLRTHVIIGDQIVSTIPAFARLRPGIRSHHERYDGKGYPDGLAGDAIPLVGRILAVADSCDAMMSDRRYRTALPRPHFETVLREHSGSQWDPKVVDAFMSGRQEIYAAMHQDETGEYAS
jgi:HD-GYP domain-containing protein (c-di-GMP phosphodiesterase class II)